MNSTYPLVLRLPQNVRGRTFAMGDIHGSYDLVLQAMAAVHFNPEIDWMLSPGDLIDRGKGSHRCAKFLSQPYVKAIRGNHEQMYIDLFRNGPPHPAVYEMLANTNYNGMGWIKNQTEEERLEILDAFQRLPIAMEVQTARGTIGLVHADVPKGMNWQTFLAKVEAGDEYVIDFATGMLDESRQRLESGRTDGVAGVDRLFVGHSVQAGGVTKYGNVYALDSGACFGEAGKMSGGHLAFMNAEMSTQILSAPRIVGTNPLIDVRAFDDQPDRPFSTLDELHEVETLRLLP